jgi:hypothetical protein
MEALVEGLNQEECEEGDVSPFDWAKTPSKK